MKPKFSVCAKFGAAVSVALVAFATFGEALYEHAIYESVSLDGAWEMAYQPYEWESRELPRFNGKLVENAVPGYWEDMEKNFRRAGITDEFRRNPFFREVTYPISGYSNDATLPNIRGCFFYRRKVRLEADKPVYLAFEGVRNQVHLWVNGCFVAFRAGFSTPFELEIPTDVQVAGENEIVLAVSNNPNLGYCGAEVCGLTTRAIFQFTGGINGHVELRKPRNGLGDVYVTTAEDLHSFTVHTSGKEVFAYTITDDEQFKATGWGQGDFTLPTADYELWSPEHPKLYTLILKTDQGVYRQRFGLRRLVVEGEKLKLNGKYVYLRGTTEHCYYPETIHLPHDLAYYREITQKRKELGFNFLRFHTFIPPVEYLQAMDELGMLVHIETPNFVSEPEFAAIIDFARKHPSVVIYCTGNETRIDRLAERYLEDVAEMVHTRTDSLFSPMSALRGLEYQLVPGKDNIVDEPFPHNPDRFARMSKYVDLYTSFQQGAASYGVIDGPSAELVDWWGDVYRKPRLSHEICIFGTYADLSLAARYPKDSPMFKTGIFTRLGEYLAGRGIDATKANLYFRNSSEWMWRMRKYTFEKLRASKRTVGYDFLGDINTHWHTCGYSVGMMDEFYRLKPGETVENVLRYNSAAVLLNDLGSSFNVPAGMEKSIAFSLSNYDADAAQVTLEVALVDEAGVVVDSGTRQFDSLPCGEVIGLGSFSLRFPEANVPRKYCLRASLKGDVIKAANEWEMYSFPKVAEVVPSDGVKVVSDISRDALLRDMDDGRTVVLLGAGPFNKLETGYVLGSAGRCHGILATVIDRSHPLFAELPNDGFCGWQFRWLMHDSYVVQLEAGVPFAPIVDVASSPKYVIHQSNLFEYRVGNGRLLVCSMMLDSPDCAAKWLKAKLLEYAASDKFAPRLTISTEQLRAAIEAPHLWGYPNANRARNPNDPGSSVRAGSLAQP